MSLLTFCANVSKNESQSAEMKEVIFDDGYKTAAENEIVFDEREVNEKEGAALMSGVNSQEIIKIASDNSKISTMFDRYGNKTETRHFNSHTRLSFILSRTSADGEKQVFVYGQNGEVKSLPENMLDKILTASADEIANSAGILQYQGQISTSVQNNPLPNPTPLRPMPSNNYPVQTHPAEPVEKIEKSPDAEQPQLQNKEATPEEEKNPLP